MTRTDRSLESVEDAIIEQYYKGNIPISVVSTVLGDDVAATVFVLQESLERDPVVPDGEDVDIPPDSEFYTE